MEFTELIRNRYSVRAYQSKPVEEEKLNIILEAARLAPTATNNQPFQLIIIHTKGREEELSKIYRKDWFVQAPIILCAVGVPSRGWVRSQDKRRYLDVDVAIVMDHVILEATNHGLGTCWIAAFNAQAAKEILHLPDEVEPLIFTPLGYAADQPKEKERKSLEELVRYERW
jgi:nitroreductase